MDQEEFINVVKDVVRDSSIEGTITNLEKPPGRKPNPKLLETSVWYNKLDYDQKKHIKNIIEMSVNDGIFGFLCVIDGVRSVEEDPEIEGVFKLSYVKDGKEVILNNPENEYLHDIYNS